MIVPYRAGVAQLIERFLAKEEAQGLSPCTRTIALMLKKEGPLRASFLMDDIDGSKFTPMTGV